MAPWPTSATRSCVGVASVDPLAGVLAVLLDSGVFAAELDREDLYR